MPVSFYKNIFDCVKKLFYDDFTQKNYFKYKTLNLPQLADYKCLMVDGSYSNTNIHAEKGILETSLNMFYYDASNGVCEDMTFNGQENSEEIVK